MDSKRSDTLPGDVPGITEPADYVALARLVLHFRGEPGRLYGNSQTEYHGGCPIHNAKFFEDEVIRIVGSIETLELGIERMENHNPVICVNPAGEIYRSHGEKHYLKERLVGLVRECIGGTVLEKT